MARRMSAGGARVSTTGPPAASTRRSSRPGIAGSATATATTPSIRASGTASSSRASASGSALSAAGSGRSVRRSTTSRPKCSARTSVRPRSSSRARLHEQLTQPLPATGLVDQGVGELGVADELPLDQEVAQPAVHRLDAHDRGLDRVERRGEVTVAIGLRCHRLGGDLLTAPRPPALDQCHGQIVRDAGVIANARVARRRPPSPGGWRL